MGGLSDIGGMLLPGFPGTSTDPFGGMLDSGGGGGGGNSPSYQPTPQGQLQHQAYQPNFESFWDPMAMSQAGQPSFDNPFWYQATESPPPPPAPPAAQPQPPAANPDALAQMRYRLGMLDQERDRPFSLFGPIR